MGVAMHMAMNSDGMRSRSGQRVYDFTCECGNEFQAKAPNALWCDDCKARKNRENDARCQRERKQRKKEDDIANNTYHCTAEVLVYVMKLMYQDCPGGMVEDCSTCLFSRPYFAGCCAKMSKHPYELGRVAL
jgi:hypothetical protein